jgi:hypothetical protein
MLTALPTSAPETLSIDAWHGPSKHKSKKKHLNTCGSLGVTNPTTRQALLCLTSVSETGTGFFAVIWSRRNGSIWVQIQSLKPLYRNKSQFRRIFAPDTLHSYACEISIKAEPRHGHDRSINGQKLNILTSQPCASSPRQGRGLGNDLSIVQQLHGKDPIVENAVGYTEFATDDLTST